MDDAAKDASQITKDLNADMASRLPWSDDQSFNDAARNFIATWHDLTILDQQAERVVWTLVPYLDRQQIHSPAPDTVNPSLWRQAKLNTLNGLFKVCDHVYQVRAFDMSNMTIIEGRTGLIIIDPLISVECSRSALQLYRAHREETAALRVKAVIHTHCHVDHFGGVEGVMPANLQEKKDVEIYAPEGFLRHAISENVSAGTAMGRRAQYMYGPSLGHGNRGQVDTGLGKGQSTGNISLYPPTVTIERTGQEELIAGVRVVFHMTNGSEAPAEMDFYFPEFRAFCVAENATHNMHNIQTLRGAAVRDALAWSKYLGEALEMFGGEAEVMFASHHWPIWGQPRIADFLARQRDMYRYLNDQTLRMLNKGYTGIEIGEVFEMPETLARDWSCRGYYGSTNHNAKAVYDKYMGFFDGDPATLHRLPPEHAAPKYVQLMGGAEAVIRAARAAGEIGEYRWASELLHHVVYADQDNGEAKDLQADMLEQMGYQAENATWRNIFLMGAQELRGGVMPAPKKPASATMIAAMTVSMIFDALGASLIGPLAARKRIVMNWVFTEPNASPYTVRVENGSLSYTAGESAQEEDVTLTLTREPLNELMSGQLSASDFIHDPRVQICGDLQALLRFFVLLDAPDGSFPIVTPRSDSRLAWTCGHLADALEGSLDALKKHALVVEARRFIGEVPAGC